MFVTDGYDAVDDAAVSMVAAYAPFATFGGFVVVAFGTANELNTRCDKFAPWKSFKRKVKASEIHKRSISTYHNSLSKLNEEYSNGEKVDGNVQL